MISVIAEHSVRLDLLPEWANILDLGCRGFTFREGILKAFGERGVYIYGVDIDYLNSDDYTRCAITNFTGKCGIWRNNDPQATRIAVGNEIDCYTLEVFSKLKGVEFWDLIKMDIEGSEYEVIMSLTKAPCKQFSIEFHIHCGQTKEQVSECVTKLESLGYEIATHELTEQHGAGFNYWSSLFILKQNT